ncbi:DUF2871 domain-containing protein [Porcincola intestinalis]|jgi:hypothetical protein|uniref:DUF2871 domain-containing protein n=1 Tax=Porcincola intestinalis TaxID=2606632 RepID=UPI002F42D5D6
MESLKRYIHTAIFYALMAMAGGVFYREFTKYNHYTGRTTLAFVHTHYFILGMLFFLLLLVLEKSFSLTDQKTRRILTAYHAGLNLTVVMLLVRGILQVKEAAISKAIDTAVSGLAGIGHIVLCVSLILLLLRIRKCIGAE